MRAVVLMSGGLDSTLCATMAVKNYGNNNVMGVSLLYGQKHSTEIEHARTIAQWLNIRHLTQQLPSVFGGSESVLITENEKDMPEASYKDIADAGGVSPTYVPYRNANLLSVATAIALVKHLQVTGLEMKYLSDIEPPIEVWAGMHAEDAAGWAYPDCTPEFLGAMANAIYIGTYHRVRLVTPLMWMTKADIVSECVRYGAPIQLTLSCYKGTVPACGVCPTCIGRIQAFIYSGLEDPIPYAIDIDWKTAIEDRFGIKFDGDQ